MSPKKSILLLVLVMYSTFSFSQKSIEDQANALTQEVNVMLTETDKNLKLSEDQTAKINKLYKALVLVRNKKKKTVKEERQLNKVLYPKLKETSNAIKALLTKEQLSQYNSYNAK